MPRGEDGPCDGQGLRGHDLETDNEWQYFCVRPSVPIVLAPEDFGMSVHVKPRSFLQVSFGSFRFYLALVTLAFALHVVNSVVSYMPFAEPLPEKELASDFQKKQVDIWAEMNKLLITLATLTIGGIGGFMLQGDKTAPHPPRQMRRAAASWIFCALSIYCGYLSYHEATWMLSLGTFNSFNPRLWWPARGQFWTFLISVIILADLIYGSIRDREETKR
jgi:hypothetical protein